MAFEHPTVAAGYVAGADLSASQYLFVKIGSSDLEVILATAGDDAIGVLSEPAADESAACVAIGGQTKIVSGADSLTAGMKVASDANGKAVEATADDAVLGTLITGGDEDEVLTMQFDKEGILAGA